MAAHPAITLQREIEKCRRCPRLVEHCTHIGAVKRRAYLEWDYWARPVPAFGDARARLMIVGLAPGAHGSNRTGRMFTGDKSGDFLYRALHETGFASQAESHARNDGLQLHDAWITAAARCAPPDNKPTPAELATCREYLRREIELLKRVCVVVALGRIAFDAYLTCLREMGRIESRAAFAFGHNVAHALGDGLPVLISSYHPSQQNTSTGRLTLPMLVEVFAQARRRIG